MATDREERIRQLAHEIWEREGHPHGRDAEHWRLATQAYEAELAAAHHAEASELRSDDDEHEDEDFPRSWSMRIPPSPAAAPAQDVSATAQPIAAEPADLAADAQIAPRKRRTRAEMEVERAAEQAQPKQKGRSKAEKAATVLAVGEAAAKAAVVTKRRRGAKAVPEAAPATIPEAPAPRRRRAKAQNIPSPDAVSTETAADMAAALPAAAAPAGAAPLESPGERTAD